MPLVSIWYGCHAFHTRFSLPSCKNKSVRKRRRQSVRHEWLSWKSLFRFLGRNRLNIDCPAAFQLCTIIMRDENVLAIIELLSRRYSSPFY